MSRPIRFRGWDTIFKKMTMDIQDDYIVGEWANDQRFVLMQFTGLCDLNGKEIYERDLLQDDEGIGEVEWVQEHCAYMVFTRDPSMYHRLESDGILKQSEVIGNVWERPHLLKGDSENE